MNLIILGSQGSGKGTQAKKLVQNFGFQYFESGNILRQKAKEKSDLGRKIDQTINQKGALLADELMMQIVSSWLDKSDFAKGIIFDGFPRNINQCLLLEKLLTSKKTQIDKVVLLNISRAVAIKRMTARRICPKCHNEYNLLTKPPKMANRCDYCQSELIRRPDDIPATIEQRLKIYYETTQPLLDYFKKQGILEAVDGERPIEVIYQDIVKRLGL